MAGGGNGFSIKPLKVKLLAGEQKATEDTTTNKSATSPIFDQICGPEVETPRFFSFGTKMLRPPLGSAPTPEAQDPLHGRIPRHGEPRATHSARKKNPDPLDRSSCDRFPCTPNPKNRSQQ